MRSTTYFRLRVQFSGQDNDIVAGTHPLNTGMTTSQIIDTITSQDNISVPETTVTFLEGWRIEQYADTLVEAGLIETPAEFIDAANDPGWNDEFSFLHSRPSGAGLEGYLFPDTYRFRDRRDALRHYPHPARDLDEGPTPNCAPRPKGSG
ncbi:MAG: endolytic transglycosylase MltG [Thermomicrobiales bacterium]